MDSDPSTSMEADKNIQHSSMLKNQYMGGGTTCCIPTCNSNTKRNPELSLVSYYKIPNDKKLRRMWLHWIGRANFRPKNHHRVCSKHFIGRPAYITHLLLWKNYCYAHKQNQKQHINAEIGTAPL